MSSKYNPVYSHFQGKKLSRVELIERLTIETILKSPLPDNKRDWGKVFELKHAAAVSQIGRMLAQKRGLDEGLAVIACTMHDIAVFSTGRAKDHAHKGAVLGGKILRKTKRFTEKEIRLITDAIHGHSDKHIISRNPYAELVKDADVLDCGLYEGVHDAYVYEKSGEALERYFARIRKVRRELSLPKDPQWDVFTYVTKHRHHGAR